MVFILSGILVGAFVAFGLYLYFAQDKMVFFPAKELIVTPDQVDIPFEDVFVNVTPTERIHGWYFQAAQTTNGKRHPTVLFFHGNAGNISHRMETISYLLSFDVNIFIFDYRGYGQSDGSPNEEHIYADAQAAYDWLINQKGCQPDEMILFGRSLGGVVAVDLATHVTCRGLIVEASFTSAEDMGKKMFPFFPVTLLLRYKLDSINKIANISCPVLITHSPEDDIVPYEFGRQLFAAAKPPKKFVQLAGTHNDLQHYRNHTYQQALSQIFTGEAKSW